MLYKIEIINNAIHGAKIKRGYLRQHVIVEKLRENGGYDIIEEEKPVPVQGFKSGKHKVDIFCLDEKNKKITLINSKSNGISHTDVPSHTVQIYLEAITGVKSIYPEYNVEYIVLRPSGEEIPEWTNHGIQTYKTAEYLGITKDNFDALYREEYERIIRENLISKLREQNKYLSKDKIKELYDYCLPLIEDIHE